MAMATRISLTILNFLDHTNLLEVCVFFYYKMLIILTHGDVHTNPGPSMFKLAHWNLNSIVAHEFSRVSILEAFMNQENLNLLAITESALKTTFLTKTLKLTDFRT